MKRSFLDIAIYSGAIIAMLPFSGGASTAMAQVDKRVEVTREFTPTVGGATKLTLTPDLSDDVYIKPDIDYTITPIVQHNFVESEAYGVAKINFYDHKTQDRIYIKGGVGLPLSGVGDFYGSFGNSSDGYLTTFANFDGIFGKITNDFDEKLSATQYNLRSGLLYSRYVGYRTLDIGAVYNHSNWSKYATNDEPNDYINKYRSTRADIRFGDSFVDLRRWNYSVNGSMDIFWNKSIVNNVVATMDIGAAVGRRLFSAVDLVIDGGFEYRHDGYYKNTTPHVGINGSYYGRKWSLSVGVDSYFDRVVDNNMVFGAANPNYDKPINNIYVIPNINFDFNVFSRQMVAYLAVSGDLKHNDYASLARINPYIYKGDYEAVNSVERNYGVGIKGSILSGKFVYDLSANYNTVKNNIYWAYCQYDDPMSDYSTNYYTTATGSLKTLNLNYEMKYMPIKSVDLWLNLDLNRFYKDEELNYEVGKAAFDMKLGGAYNIEKFKVGMDLNIFSRRHFTEIYSINPIEVNAAVDLNVFAEWNINRRASLWIEANNLLGSSLYNWARYRGYGINGMVGAKVQF
ncbi:MAG: hypothetical protein SNH79_06070 [Rikenellaceae bacterium]